MAVSQQRGPLIYIYIYLYGTPPMDPPILRAERLVWLYERYTAHNRWIHGGGFHSNRAESLIKVAEA